LVVSDLLLKLYFLEGTILFVYIFVLFILGVAPFKCFF